MSLQWRTYISKPAPKSRVTSLEFLKVQFCVRTFQFRDCLEMLPLVVSSAGESACRQGFPEPAACSHGNTVYGIPGIASTGQFALMRKGKYTYQLKKNKANTTPSMPPAGKTQRNVIWMENTLICRKQLLPRG